MASNFGEGTGAVAVVASSEDTSSEKQLSFAHHQFTILGGEEERRNLQFCTLSHSQQSNFIVNKPENTNARLVRITRKVVKSQAIKSEGNGHTRRRGRQADSESVEAAESLCEV